MKIFKRVILSLQKHDDENVSTPADWKPGDDVVMGSPLTLEEAEESTIRNTLARCNGNLSMVAKELGISRPTLYSKLKKYGI